MRHLLHLLIIITLIGMVTTSHAEEVYLGRVISVDRESGRLSVALIDEGIGDMPVAASSNGLEVNIPKERLPEQLSTGSVVRIWGNMSGESLALDASRLILTGQGVRTKDPTGVRRRIGKSRGHYGGRKGGKGHGRR